MIPLFASIFPKSTPDDSNDPTHALVLNDLSGISFETVPRCNRIRCKYLFYETTGYTANICRSRAHAFTLRYARLIDAKVSVGRADRRRRESVYRTARRGSLWWSCSVCEKRGRTSCVIVGVTLTFILWAIRWYRRKRKR